MDRKKKLQIELYMRGLESQAKRLIDCAITLKDAGQLDMAEKAVSQAKELLKAIKDLRNINQL